MDIPTDKFGHFIVGALIGGVCALCMQIAFKGAPIWVLAAMAFIGAAGAGVVREIWQLRTGRGQADVMDAVATIAGGLVAALGVLFAA